jgi:hypothetical protein
MKYFKDCKTIQEVKAKYRQLAKELHPDKNGSTELMQNLNTEYAFVIAKLAKGESITEEEINRIITASEAYKNAITAVIHCMGITIEVVGSWIWISGETKAIKEILKANGFVWAKKKENLSLWFFRSEEFSCKNRFAKHTEFNVIKNKYGSYEIKTKEFDKLH